MSTVVALVNGVLYCDPVTLAKSAVMVDIISYGHLLRPTALASGQNTHTPINSPAVRFTNEFYDL